MPNSTVVAIVIIFAVIGACCVLGGAMMAACYAMDAVWERCARLRGRRASRNSRSVIARPVVSGELRGYGWSEHDNNLYLTGFDAWGREISPEGNTSE
jgi:hypothetical protein